MTTTDDREQGPDRRGDERLASALLDRADATKDLAYISAWAGVEQDIAHLTEALRISQKYLREIASVTGADISEASTTCDLLIARVEANSAKRRAAAQQRNALQVCGDVLETARRQNAQDQADRKNPPVFTDCNKTNPLPPTGPESAILEAWRKTPTGHDAAPLPLVSSGQGTSRVDIHEPGEACLDCHQPMSEHRPVDGRTEAESRGITDGLACPEKGQDDGRD